MNSPKEMTLLVLRGASLLFGSVLLIFGIGDLLIPRAGFVSSTPEPGATIATPPTSVIVRFNKELSAESEIDVVSTVRLLPSGQHDYLNGKTVVVASGIDASDPSKRSLRADLRPGLHDGLYFINWRTSSAGWRAISFGRSSFGVGMRVPDHITRDMGGAFRERTSRWRGRRASLIGGVILFVMAFALPLFKRS